MKTVLTAICAAALVSCGGGGGSGASDYYAGTYGGTLARTEDDCPFVVSQTRDVSAIINQDDSRIVVQIVYVDGSTSDGGCTELARADISCVAQWEPEAGCTIVDTVRLSEIDGDGAHMAFSRQVQCGYSECRVTYEADVPRS